MVCRGLGAGSGASLAGGDEAGRKSLSKETSFGTDVSDPRLLRDTLANLAAEVARLARREGLAGKVVTLKIRFQEFETYSRQQRLDHPSQDDRTLLATAWSLYETADLPRKPVRLIGLGISDLGPPQPVQQDLFDGGPNRTLDSARDRSLNATLDRVNARCGPGTLRRGGGH